MESSKTANTGRHTQSTRKALNEGMNYRGVEQFRGCGVEFLIHEDMDTLSVIARLSYRVRKGFPTSYHPLRNE
jgi:hypothetical protein